MNEEWQETKKEFQVNEKGEYVVKSVIMEIKKEKILGFEKKIFGIRLLKL